MFDFIPFLILLQYFLTSSRQFFSRFGLRRRSSNSPRSSKVTWSWHSEDIWVFRSDKILFRFSSDRHWIISCFDFFWFPSILHNFLMSLLHARNGMFEFWKKTSQINKTVPVQKCRNSKQSEFVTVRIDNRPRFKTNCPNWELSWFKTVPIQNRPSPKLSRFKTVPIQNRQDLKLPQFKTVRIQNCPKIYLCKMHMKVCSCLMK